MDKLDTDLIEAAKMDFDAMITDEQMQKMEENAVSWGNDRRASLAVLARSKQQLVDGFKDNPDLIMELTEGIIKYRDFTKSVLEAAESAIARLIIVSSALVREEEEND